MIKLCIASAFAATLGLMQAPSLFAATLSPGQTLQVTFTAVPSASNLLFLYIFPTLTTTGSPTLTTQLYDGGVLLSTLTNTLNSGFYIAEFTSPAVFPGCCTSPTASADLTSLDSGTIKGTFKVTVSGGTVGNIDLVNLAGNNAVALSTGIYANPISYVGVDSATRTSATITPEPTSVLLSLAGILLVGAKIELRRRRLTNRRLPSAFPE